MISRKNGPLRPVVQRPALVEQVLEQLRTQILSSDFAGGTELPPEGALAETLGVSRTVIREAMRSLRAQGLVEVSQGRRPRVKAADPQAAIESLGALLQRRDGTVLNLVEARRPLESEIAYLAAQRATPEHLEMLERCLDDQLSAGTLEGRITADMRFHALLAEATGNPVFQTLLGAIWSLLRQSLMQTISRTGSERAVRGHRRVLDAVRCRDGAAAQQAMLEHLRMAEQDLKTLA